jgi:putative CocE/NonD family hydrolase
MFCDHQLRDYAELMQKVSPDTRKHINLVMGPWNHGGIGQPSTPLANGGFMDLGRDLFPMHFFEFWLKGKMTPRWQKQPPVKFYVMGRNRWYYASRWPPRGITPQRWYLHSEGNANSAQGDGMLSLQPPRREFADRYIFDPMNPVFTEGGQNLYLPKVSVPQARAESRQDVLVYSSPPLEEDLVVTGPIALKFWASSSAIDTDFMAKLCDVHPNGKSYIIVDMGLRCRYRKGNDPESLVPGQIYPLEIALGNTAMCWKKGHRLRLSITSSNFPRYDVNSNLGGILGSQKYEKAEQQIYHTEGKTSCLILPVLPKEGKE